MSAYDVTKFCVNPAAVLHVLVYLLGLPANSSEEIIRYFFENRRKSAGAQIEDLMVLPDKVVITYATNDGKHDDLLTSYHREHKYLYLVYMYLRFVPY